ncbi:MAG: DUF4255 domain-containing protein [Desulfobacteraceae bacterium]|nr:DUF4255 domain-containing protein [Desulfobacteraceae bacterium]
MLEKPLKFIADSLDNYLRIRNRIVSNERVLVLTDIVDEQGKFAVKQGTVGLTLFNVEEERVNRAQVAEVIRGQGGTLGYANPALRLNLYLLFVANFKDYEDSIKNISSVIGFFQANNVFQPETHPELSSSIEKIVFELSSHSFEQMSYVWGILGTNYRPSIMYRMRLVVIQEGLRKQGGAVVDQTGFKGRGMN